MSTFDLDAICEAAAGIEPLPTSVGRLAALALAPDADLAEIVELVSFDQSLAMSVLRAANSASHGTSRKIALVRDAVMRIGGGAVLGLAVGRRVRAMTGGALPAYHLAEGELWRHSVAAALAAERMPSVCRVAVPPEAFTAALLHDVGKLILVRFLSPDIAAAIDRAHAEAGVSRLDAEREILGVDHGELAELVAQAWQLPEALAKPLAAHHAPTEDDGRVADVVHAADAVARRIGTGGEDDPQDPDVAVLARLRIGDGAFEALAADVGESLQEVMRRYAA
jgi:HD-like signal output (HDOD) protein